VIFTGGGCSQAKAVEFFGPTKSIIISLVNIANDYGSPTRSFDTELEYLVAAIRHREVELYFFAKIELN
jgi:hypothetical protein